MYKTYKEFHVLTVPTFPPLQNSMIFPLADLEGGMPGARTPKGPNSFILTYKIFET